MNDPVVQGPLALLVIAEQEMLQAKAEIKRLRADLGTSRQAAKEAERDYIRASAERDRLRAINADLLAALQDMLSWASTPRNEASPSWIIGACARARAAIAKATGAP
jgi:hypothetical protein